MTIRISRDPIYLRRRFSAETIELCVRWYITYRLSYRDLVAMMAEREIAVSHTTVMRWVLRYVPEYERRWARFARSPGSSWRMDETAVNVRGGRHYLYRERKNACADHMLRSRQSNDATDFPSLSTASARKASDGPARSISTGIRQLIEACDCSPRKITAGERWKYERTATSIM
jgi:transposase-like protein